MFRFLSIFGLEISVTNKDIAILPRYILSTDLLGAGFSSHWAPYWRSCTPCHFSYDIIMKVLIHSINIIDQLLSTILGSKNLLFFRPLIDLALIIFSSWRLVPMTLPISGKRLASTVRQDFNLHSPPLVVSQSYWTISPGTYTMGEQKQWNLHAPECWTQRVSL